MSARIKALRRLEEMGGEIDEAEVIYQLGESAVIELLEAETEGLVISRTTFEVSETGRALLGEKAAGE